MGDIRNPRVHSGSIKYPGLISSIVLSSAIDNKRGFKIERWGRKMAPEGNRRTGMTGTIIIKDALVFTSATPR